MTDLELLDRNIRRLAVLRQQRAQINKDIDALCDETDRIRARVEATTQESVHG